jgi:hypothetical protein
MQLQQLEANIKFWFTNHSIAIVWAFMVINNLFEKVLLGTLQTMRCHICHITKQVQSSNSTTHECKSLLTHNPTHGITFMKKHIDNEHEAIVATYVLDHRVKMKFPVQVMRRARNANKLHLSQCLWKSKLASKKIEDPYEIQVCFKSYNFPRDIGICSCHHNLL